jgi:trk system potassium uptake protein TrkH
MAGENHPLLAQVFVSTVVLEAIGAAWYACFHAVSAFCNAGFSLRSDNLMGDRANPAVILPIAGLIILGGLGFGVLTEVGASFRTRVCDRRATRLSLHAKVTLATTGVLLLLGTVGFWAFESGNLLRDTTLRSQILTSFFASVTPRTAGFNSIDYARTTTATLFLTVVLMTIGGCPGSTAGWEAHRHRADVRRPSRAPDSGHGNLPQEAGARPVRLAEEPIMIG